MQDPKQESKNLCGFATVARVVQRLEGSFAARSEGRAPWYKSEAFSASEPASAGRVNVDEKLPWKSLRTLVELKLIKNFE
jgi:hypothetical protein